MRGWNGTEGLTGRHRGRPLRWVLGTHFLLLSALVSTPATPQSLRDSVSLRLGHGAALTCPRHVIHYRAAASLPKRGAKGAVQPLRQSQILAAILAAKRCPY